MNASKPIRWTITRTGGGLVQFNERRKDMRYEAFDHLDAPNVMAAGSCVCWTEEKTEREHGAQITWRTN